MAVAGSHVYWTGYHDGSVGAANLGGTDPHAIVTGQDADDVAVSAP